MPLLASIVTALGGVPIGQTEVPLLKQILLLIEQNGTGSGGGGAPTGPASGDLSSNYPGPTVAKVAGQTPTVTGLSLLTAADTAAARAALGIFPSLPTWTWAAGGTASSQEFATGNNAISSTASIAFNQTAKYGDADWDTFFASLPGALSGSGLILILTDSLGRPSVFRVTAIATGGGVASLDVTAMVFQSGNWSGDYTLSFANFQLALDPILNLSGVTPPPDGTVTPVTSVTTQLGIVTAIS